MQTFRSVLQPGVTAWEQEDDGEDEGEGYGPGVVEVGEWSSRRYSGEGGGEEGLRAIRDQTLHDAGSRVEDGGALAWIDTEAPRDISGKSAYRDDGHCIVGRAEVYYSDEHGKSGLRAPETGYTRCQDAEDIVNASAGLDHAKHS